MAVPVTAETRFGASTVSPHVAAALLRAFAVRYGATLTSPADVDLAAAVCGAEIAGAVCGVHRLEDFRVCGPTALQAIAATLCRAAGELAEAGPVEPMGAETSPVPEFVQAAVERCVSWCERWGHPVNEIAVRVLYDLSVGGPELHAAARTLAAWPAARTSAF